MSTLATLLESLGLHLSWWARALVSWRDPRAPMSGRRALVLVLGMPVFMLVQGVHTFCLLLDEVLFPGYRRQYVGEALFITGIPRSGTTFLHRTLAVESESWTMLTTWEALLAPSVTQRRIVRLLARLDRALGGYARGGLDAATRRLTGGLEAIHQVGLDAAEEDYFTLLPAGGCLILLLAFPGAPGLQALGHLDRSVPAGRRRRLLRFYHRCLQRHLYADGGRRTLLSKNAAFGSWLRGLHEEFPEARFLICVREPEAALSSQVSSVADARTLFGTAVDGAEFQELFLDMFAETLEHLADTLGLLPEYRAAVVDMDDLRAEPAGVVGNALARLEIDPGATLTRHLDRLPRNPGSSHRHDVADLALERDTIRRRLRPSYERLLQLRHRIGVPS